MLSENRITFWGDMEQVSRLLEEAEKKFTNLWEGGQYRMLPADIERMGAYLSRIRNLQAKMARTRNNFVPIAMPKEELKRIATSFENVGLIPKALSTHE